MCEPIQWRICTEKVDWFAAQHVAQGGTFAHSGLTIRHTRHDSLAKLLNRLGESWKGLRNHAEFRRARDDLGASAVVVLQITWSPANGWHPHYHVMWFIDHDQLGVFPQALNRAWATQTGRYGPAAQQTKTELIVDRDGFWRYVKDDTDPRHPKNDCLHPDHMGCDNCLPRGTFRGKPVKPVPDPTYPAMPDPTYRRNFEVFTELGAAALDGSQTARSLLRHYIGGTVGVGRIRRLSHLTKRYGKPDVADYIPHSPGGERLWISGEVVAAVELANRGTGSPLDAIEDPETTARMWSALLDGRCIEIVTAPDDGAPMLRFKETTKWT